MNHHDICDALINSQCFIYDCAMAAQQNGYDCIQAVIVEDKLVLTYSPPHYSLIEDHTLTQPVNVKQLPDSIGSQVIETYHYDLLDDTQVMLNAAEKMVDELIDDVMLIAAKCCAKPQP